jgi:anti-sigma regulatory factor (Ser/Thr protein kinase)
VKRASQGNTGYVHEAVYYEDTAGLVAATAPLLRRALARGEDVALVCSDRTNRAVHGAVGWDDRVSVLPRGGVYRKAVSAVAYFRDFVEERVAAGAHRVVALGEVNFGSDRRALDEWRRYEALLNHAMAPLPLWSLCAYNTRATDPVLTAAALTHPHIREGSAQVRNPRYVDPAELIREVDSASELVPRLDPVLTIQEVRDLGELRRDLMTLLAGGSMPKERAEDLVTAVHEVVTNGGRHGEPPVTVHVWITPVRVTCTVTDRGPGFDDPFTGYIRGGGSALPEGQYGLWLARELCDELVLARTDEGFTARLAMHPRPRPVTAEARR